MGLLTYVLTVWKSKSCWQVTHYSGETFDYGIDGYVSTFNDSGEIEPGHINIQVKATEQGAFSQKENGWACDLAVKDLENWLYGMSFTLLVLYVAARDCVFYLELQEYFLNKGINLQDGHKFVRVFVPTENALTSTAAQSFRVKKNQLYGVR